MAIGPQDIELLRQRHDWLPADLASPAGDADADKERARIADAVSRDRAADRGDIDRHRPDRAARAFGEFGQTTILSVHDREVGERRGAAKGLVVDQDAEQRAGDGVAGDPAREGGLEIGDARRAVRLRRPRARHVVVGLEVFAALAHEDARRELRKRQE